MRKSAVISECGVYRYTLSRAQNPKDGVLTYIGVNPSTADSNIDDRTIVKMLGFCTRAGYGSFIVVNLFAYRATDVNRLRDVSDPIGPSTDSYVKEAFDNSDILVPCWGRLSKLPKRLHGRVEDMWRLIDAANKPIYTLGYTKCQQPRHPLMLSYSVNLIKHTC